MYLHNFLDSNEMLFAVLYIKISLLSQKFIKNALCHIKPLTKVLLLRYSIYKFNAIESFTKSPSIFQLISENKARKRCLSMMTAITGRS